MSTLSQISRGTVLLISMALVACYIDVYTTGKFPWQHAAAETPVTIPPPEFVNDPTVQPVQYVAEQGATQPTPVFLPGSKSDVAGGVSILQTPTANGQTNTATTTVPMFMSGSKSYGGATGLVPGTLNLPPTPTPTPQADQKSPSFMGGSKTIMLPTRLPESANTNPATATQADKMQFMGGTKSPGPIVMPGSSAPTPTYAPPPAPQATQTGDKLQGYPTTIPVQGTAPPTSPPAYNTPSSATPQFMSGAKSPIREVPRDLFATPPPTQQPTAPNMMQTAPVQTAPRKVPNLPPSWQQPTPSFNGNKPNSPAGSY